MRPWWGQDCHDAHERKVLSQIEAVYLPRFVCSNENVLVILRKFPETPPCTAGVRFEWVLQWEQPAEIKVWIRCSCAEINEFFHVFLNDAGEIVSDSVAPWKLPVAA